jgi:protein-tyrosine phosphatase
MWDAGQESIDREVSVCAPHFRGRLGCIANNMISNKKVAVLFVCTGNICRSPTAEGVFRSMVERASRANQISCASAGTHGYHIGEPPDLRAQDAALRRGYNLKAQRARKVLPEDFNDFDLMLAMDLENIAALERMRPAGARIAPELFLEYVDLPGLGSKPREVADPYYGSARGFDAMLDVIEAGAAKLLAMLGTGKA